MKRILIVFESGKSERRSLDSEVMGVCEFCGEEIGELRSEEHGCFGGLLEAEIGWAEEEENVVGDGSGFGDDAASMGGDDSEEGVSRRRRM